MKESPPQVFEEIRRQVAGIDIAGHADHYVCGPRRDDGGHDIAHFGTTTSELSRMAAWLAERGVESVAMESTSVYWIPVAELLESGGVEVVLVDTREVRMVPGRKSDVKDCQWLQRLHSCGLLRGGFRPPEDVAAIRSVLRERENVVTVRTQFVQQMQKSLDQMNVRVHHAVANICGKTGMAIVGAIVAGERDPLALAALRDGRCHKSEKEIAEHLRGTWREEHIFNLRKAYEAVGFLDGQIADYDNKVAAMFAAMAEKCDNEPPPPLPPPKRAKDKLYVAERQDIRRIAGFDMMSIPGISYNTMSTVVAEMGSDLSRFPTEKHFASYIGLAPSLGKSAGKNVRQRKPRNSHRAGRALRMAASTLYRSDSELGAHYRSVARRTDKRTAVKATARRMAHMIYRGMRYGQEYLDLGAEAYEARRRSKALNTVKRLVKMHGFNEMELSPATA